MIGTKSGNPSDDTSWAMGAYMLPPAPGILIFYYGPSTSVYANRPGDNNGVYPCAAAATNVPRKRRR